MPFMSYLQNHLLIAMPSLEDPFFERSVVYLCEHNEEGAMGLTLNVPLELNLYDLLVQMKLPEPGEHLKEVPVLAGGPVHNDRGFVLHTPQAGYHSSRALSDDLMITTSLDILTNLGTDAAPEQYLVTLGYAGWEAGQLEQELLENSWLTVPASLDLLFDTPMVDLWQAATATLGINIWQMPQQAGHA